MKSTVILVAILWSFFSVGLAADEAPSYSFFEVSAIEYDIDTSALDADPDGYKLKLSAELGDSLFAFVDRAEAESSFSGNKFDFDREGYGFGLRGDSWYGSYSYNTWDLGSNEFEVDTIRLGFRNYLTDWFEFNASYAWNNIEHADNDDGFQVGFVFELTEFLHLSADYETIGGNFDVDYASIGLRLSF